MVVTRAKISVAMITRVLAELPRSLKGRKQSPEHIVNRFASRKGYKHTPESKAKISEMLKGRKLSKKTRAKMSASKIGNQNFKGRKHSPETRVKMSAAKLGCKQSPEHIANKVAARKKNRGKK